MEIQTGLHERKSVNKTIVLHHRLNFIFPVQYWSITTSPPIKNHKVKCLSTNEIKGLQLDQTINTIPEISRRKLICK